MFNCSQNTLFEMPAGEQQNRPFGNGTVFFFVVKTDFSTSASFWSAWSLYTLFWSALKAGGRCLAPVLPFEGLGGSSGAQLL